MVDVAPVPSRWEEQALERTLAPARARSAAQVRRIVRAARELAAECGLSAADVARLGIGWVLRNPDALRGAARREADQSNRAVEAA